METQGIVIWAATGSGALIVWCADNGALAYVADRHTVGDAHGALCVGDFIDLRIETVGAMRVGSNLRYRSSGAGWVQNELGREAAANPGAVISPDDRLSQGLGFGSSAVDAGQENPPANRPSKNGTGAA